VSGSGSSTKDITEALVQDAGQLLEARAVRRLTTQSIPNEALQPTDVPPADAGWKEIERFALTFNGYAEIGLRLGDLADEHARSGTVPTDLGELRGCLFFEQRRWRRFDAPPGGKPMEHVSRLLEAIRAAVSAR
jgi:hypothetical protein